VKEFEVVFQSFHQESVWRGCGVMKNFKKLLAEKFPNVPEMVIDKYARTRTFIRLKHLNKDAKSVGVRQRNVKQLHQFRT
jgi:hypothetical protein